MENKTIKLYQHGCPRCVILKKMLDEKHIQYENITDQNLMRAMGFTEAPKLEVNGVVMGFKDAKKWVEEQ